REGREPLKVLEKEALALEVYQQRYKQLQTEITDEQVKLAKLVQEENALTAQAQNLRKEIAQEQLAELRSREEQALLQTMRYNTVAEGELLLKRRHALEARLKELLGTTAAAPR
ncbi:MAG: hypothetical protein NZ700_15245, partial [Gemmataceae bacterium]|nr:hypothetical protein [Gemmataceae bacterium]MDW8266179.1 hypothetical protein [Gemmataceae bacterium]